MTGVLSTCGLQFSDWSAPYRLFARRRVQPDRLFDVVRRNAVELLPPQEPLTIALDDTLLPKSGTHIPGVAYRRDPLGPRFQVNLIRAQRFVQFSLAVPDLQQPGACRMVPIDFHHAPTPAKLRRNATAEQWAVYRQARKQSNLVTQALDRLRHIVASAPGRPLRLLVDGGYTNNTFFRGLPQGVQVIGRIRKDAKLHFPAHPPQPGQLGRTRRYGDLAPTPEQLRCDESVPWQSVRVFAAGRYHDFRVKTLNRLLWRSAGYQRPLRLLVIAPLAYRPAKNSRVLYRQPAFLICTELALDLATLLQRYVWRWEIEVNHREEKTLFGVGQAQVRQPDSANAVPAFTVACYAMLLLAALRLARNHGLPDVLPPPKWGRKSPPRTSTQQLINTLRSELWARALGLANFSGFVNSTPSPATSLKSPDALRSAVLYAVA